MKRVPIWRVLPVVFLVAFYWQGLDTWFYQDDFGWLNVRREIHGWADVLPALFAPKAHGNMRPLSENGFFTLFSTVFGVDALPFRIWVFLTQAAAMVLLGSVVRRLSGSQAAALWAQIFWAANCGVAVVMCWTCIYNQSLCAFFLLLAFRCLLEWIDTGQRRWQAAHWAAFLAGFGALEINVVYPVLAALYTWFAARKRFRSTLPMFAVSALYAVVHFAAAPHAAGGVYGLHPDLSMAATSWTYWRMALGPARLAAVVPLPAWVVWAATALLTAAAAAALRARGAWIGLAWFALTLAPYLPMRDHVMDYYLAVPAAGLGMLGGWGVARAWGAGGIARAAAVLAAGVYLAFSLPASAAVVRWHHDRSRAVENLVLGVAEIHAEQPAATILLSGVGTDLFYAGIVDVPFRVLEIPRVYLVPGADAAIVAPAGLANKFVLPETLATCELQRGRALVYDASGPVLRNVTGRYRALAATWRDGTPQFVNIADPMFAEYLGGDWGAARDGYRRMQGAASFRIAAPAKAGERLWLGIFTRGVPIVRVQVEGLALWMETTERYPDRTDLLFALPAALVGRPEMKVTVSSDAPLTFGFAEVR